MMRLILLLITTINLTCQIYSQSKPYQFENVGITTEIGIKLNENIQFTDEFNKLVNLKDLLNNKPTIINFVYLNCPLLCHLMLDGLANVIENSEYSIYKDYQIITISIDPEETNKNLRAYKKKYYEKLNIHNGWVFLKGTKESIKNITKFFGYEYKYIPRTNDYAHPSVLFFYNGKIANYIEGVTYNKNVFDYSLMNIKTKKSLREKIVTYCYYFDPNTQTYSLLIFKILRLFCLITVILLFIMISYFIYKERKMK